LKTILAITRELGLVRNLQDAGYRVIIANEGQLASPVVLQERADLVLLDLGLFGVDGLEFCRQLRRATGRPILVLTACLEEAERAVAYEMCADDFVQKPSGPGQVVARAQALMHLAGRRLMASRDVIRVGDLALNPVHHQVTVAGKRVDLTRTELALLAALAAEPGHEFSRTQLREVLNDNRGISERTIDSHIKNLRAKIEPDPRQPRYVLTVYGIGYKLSG
jgi:DNA-binding response OmpR family regulator